ncbi:MAG: CYTH and CHAD domain-containing protein [Actinomycetota bacterium]|nr:CYTH and CHAD domain-containing protein [Actinomycetota bacterium]
MTPVQVHREIERKFRVPAQFAFPDLSTTAVISAWEAGEPFEMTAVYYDTPELRLFRWRITMRRRVGGTDAGWHLKLPVSKADESTRDEIQLPLAAGAPGVVPATLADIISPLVRGAQLLPLVTVATRRSPYLVLDANGAGIIEIVDDQVEVSETANQTTTSFREIEVEVLDAEDKTALALMGSIVSIFINAGAVPGSTSKAASAFGARATGPPDIPAIPMTTREGVAVDAIRSIIAEHARHLLFADVGVRRDAEDSVHQMRVAARRLRSTLRTFGPLLDEEWTTTLTEELAWMAQEMGAIRDTEVLLKRLVKDAKVLDPNDQLAPSAITSWLQARLVSARAGALAGLRSDRHEYLLEDLVTAAREPKVRDEAYLPCEEVLPKLIAREWSALRKSVSELQESTPSTVWHRARIKAKRARYAVEAVAPIFGPPVTAFGRALAEVTEVLGDHQDTYIAQHLLVELVNRSDGPTAFRLGRLYAYEIEREMAYRNDFVKLWPTVRKAAKRSGLV